MPDTPTIRRATLVRGPSSDLGTFGRLSFGEHQVHSVELPWRNNLTGKSCIPPAVYRCEQVKSPRFGRVYEVRDVPGRSNILIHAANFGGNVDKGYDTDLLGCIAPAMAVGVLRNRRDSDQKAGLKSGDALQLLHAWGAGIPFELEIR
ncbi:UNVERIFIED_ORG: DUF5675 family protein [Shinella sp. XGS7]|nr:DUF5675 family protein [Shinella sp. XGS7]